MIMQRLTGLAKKVVFCVGVMGSGIIISNGHSRYYDGAVSGEIPPYCSFIDYSNNREADIERTIKELSERMSGRTSFSEFCKRQGYPDDLTKNPINNFGPYDIVLSSDYPGYSSHLSISRDIRLPYYNSAPINYPRPLIKEASKEIKKGYKKFQKEYEDFMNKNFKRRRLYKNWVNGLQDEADKGKPRMKEDPIPKKNRPKPYFNSMKGGERK